MDDALFGYTGFVGSNLARQHRFDKSFNSANAGESRGRDFGLVVFSAARAEKWRINQNPGEDLRHIEELENTIGGCTARQFVLISTVDVYGSPQGVDERTPIDFDGLHAYGRHRYQLEQHVREVYPDALIVRLPGLFGPGLKKNVIFDFLTNNNVNRIHSESSFQYYNLDNLFRDITTAQEAGLTLVNFSTEPIRTGDIAQAVFGRDFANAPEGVSEVHYDMHCLYADSFGSTGPYLYSREQTLREMVAFIGRERAASA